MPTKIIKAEDGKTYEVEVIREIKDRWMPKHNEGYWSIDLDKSDGIVACVNGYEQETSNHARLGIFPNTSQGLEDARLHFEYLCAVTEASRWLPKKDNEAWYTTTDTGEIEKCTISSDQIYFDQYFPTEAKAKAFSEIAIRHAEMCGRYN
ncbi:MAG: hypothetical protein WC455_10345 [Dehalococcoidia bacterium]|jgi:hypothetical protein